ncbi:MAG: chemotaxis protein CheX [Candidatus Dadabacteria bacterium]|nr:MAG: chemotaxis protein CheX [Candidatus Dadabacteria bacterium]
MEDKLIQPFINATLNVIGTMASVPLEAGEVYIKNDPKTWGQVTGIVGMAGEEVSGNMVASFDTGSICEIVSSMLGEDHTEINDDITDAVGELTNMISSNARSELSKLNIELDMAIPMVVVGEGLQISQLGENQVTVIPFKTPKGEFVVAVGLSSK